MFAETIKKDIMDWDGSYTQIRMHSGRTDCNCGHHDNCNVSGLGSYHWHHGWGPHMHPCTGSGESLIKLMRGFESKGYVVEIYSTTIIPPAYVGVIHVSQNKRIELFITDDENDDDDAFFLIEDGDRQLIENFWSRELNAQHVINLLSPWKGVGFRVNSKYLTALLNKHLDTNEPGKDIPTDAVPITIKIIGIDGMHHDQKGFIINGISYSYDPFNLFEMLGYTYIDMIYDNDDSALPSEFKIGFLETDVSTVSVTNFTENEKPWVCVALNTLRDLGHTVEWDEDTRTVFVDYEGLGMSILSYSQNGAIFICEEEMTNGYAKAHGLLRIDNTVKEIGIYPHYVAASGSGGNSADGYITVGYGIAIPDLNSTEGNHQALITKCNLTGKKFDVKTTQDFKNFYNQDIVAYKASTGATNNNPFPVRVPNTNYVSFADAYTDFETLLPTYVGYLNAYLDRFGIVITQQHHYDALLSLCYNTSGWTYSTDPNEYDFIKWLIDDPVKNAKLIGDEIASWRDNKDRRRREGDLFEKAIYNPTR